MRQSFPLSILYLVTYSLISCYAECPCGDWQRQYATLHNATLAGEQPARFTVSISVEAGVADRLVGLMSEFYYSLISKRAFQTLTYGFLPGWEAAFDYANINWTAPHYPAAWYDHLKFTYKNVRGYSGERKLPAEVNASVVASVYHINQPTTSFFVHSNLSTLPNGYDIPYVLFASNRGNVFRLFQNPFHAAELSEMGLRPELAFYCGFYFLFKPNAQVISIAQPTLDMLAASNVLKIGIQIRTGDSAFANHTITDISPYDAFFRCAEEIEQSRRTSPQQQVIWYLISDSVSLRRAAKAKYGSRILADIVTQQYHVDCNGINAHACREHTMNTALQHAIADIIAFSRTDFHVISRHSGFGKIGALLSTNWNHIYSVDGSVRKCGLFDYDSLEAVADEHSGV